MHHDIFKITTSVGDAVKIDTEGNASFAGTITSDSAEITGGSITIKSDNDEVVFSANSDKIYTKGEIIATKGSIGNWEVKNGELRGTAEYALEQFYFGLSTTNYGVFYAGTKDNPEIG
jgi:hypothetical protein